MNDVRNTCWGIPPPKDLHLQVISPVGKHGVRAWHLSLACWSSGLDFPSCPGWLPGEPEHSLTSPCGLAPCPSQPLSRGPALCCGGAPPHRLLGGSLWADGQSTPMEAPPAHGQQGPCVGASRAGPGPFSTGKRSQLGLQPSLSACALPSEPVKGCLSQPGRLATRNQKVGEKTWFCSCAPIPYHFPSLPRLLHREQLSNCHRGAMGRPEGRHPHPTSACLQVP